MIDVLFEFNFRVWFTYAVDFAYLTFEKYLYIHILCEQSLQSYNIFR